MTATLTPASIYASPYPDLELFGGTVYEQIFNDLTDEDAARTAITELTTGDTITYSELQRKADAVAGYLAQRGIGPGSVVSLQTPNSINFAVALFGIFRAGATVNPIGVLMNNGDVEKSRRWPAQTSSSGSPTLGAGSVWEKGIWRGSSISNCPLLMSTLTGPRSRRCRFLRARPGCRRASC